METHFANN